MLQIVFCERRQESPPIAIPISFLIGQGQDQLDQDQLDQDQMDKIYNTSCMLIRSVILTFGRSMGYGATFSVLFLTWVI